MKIIYSLVGVLLFAQSIPAQTNAPTNPTALPAFPSLPAPRRPVPLRGAASTNATALSATNPVATPNAATTSAAPTSPATTPNAVRAPSPLAPPTIGAAPATAPAPANGAARTNAVGEVANIHYDFQKMELDQILDIYSDLVGRTLLRGTGLVPTMQITLKTQSDLTRSEAITALQTVLAMNGVTFVPIGDKFAKVVLEPQAGQAGGAFSQKTAEELREAGEFVTHIVQLKYAEATEVMGAIQPFAKNPTAIIAIPTSNTLILRDYSENVKRMLEIIENLDKVNQLIIKPEVIPIKYALASDIQQVLGSLTASGPGISVGRSSRGASTTPGGYQPGAPGMGGIQGQPNPMSSQPGLGSAGTTGRSAFQRNLNSIVSRIAAGGSGDFQVLGEAKIIADDRTNSLLIFANDQDMVMIKTIISQLDVVLAQVLIEAIIMEVSLGDTKNLGISYLQHPQRFGGDFIGAGGVNNGQAFPGSSGTNGSPGGDLANLVGIGDLPSGLSYFGKIGDDLDVAVTAIATDSRVNVLSRPRIQTSHAVPATLFIGDTVPYITGSSYGDFGGSFGNARSTYQEKRVGITLDVLPLINPDGLVVMDIQQNIQQLGPSVTIDGNDVPTTTERTATAKVAVRDRETIILGGFISTTKSKGDSGVPYLKDIPLLGALFRSSTKRDNRVELIVMLRPTVLPSPESAALVAASEKDKLYGIKQGEFEIREEERKNQERIEREMRKKLGIKERPL